MSNMNPWNNSTNTIAAQLAGQFETPAGAQAKADTAEQNAKTAAQTALAAHTNTSNTTAHTGNNIVQDSTHRFVSDAEKTTWNAKADSTVATTTTNGLMSSSDKSKLDGVSAGAQPNQNAFAAINSAMATQPSDTLMLTGGTGITVSGTGKTVTITATGTSTPGAHASTHITGGSDVIPNAVAGGASGLMSGADKTKLDGVATNANNYVHPTTHPPSIIAQDSSNRFVSDSQISSWDAKETTSGAQTKANTAETNAKNFTQTNVINTGYVGVPQSLSGYTDFNTILSPGRYQFVATSTLANEAMSTSNPRRMTIEFETFSNSVTQQTVFYLAAEFAGFAFWRVYDGNWSTWRLLSDGMSFVGFNSPEGVVTAPVGSTFKRRDGGANTSFYVKQSGSGNTGWVAK